MTRLDSVIRRLQAQRSVIDWAAGEVASRRGLILELGLGNGRTYRRPLAQDTPELDRHGGREASAPAASSSG